MTRRTYQLTPPPGASEPGASSKQLDYIADLLAKREIPREEARAAMLARVEAQRELNREHGDCAVPPGRVGLTKQRATECIKRLLAMPERPLRRTPRAELRDRSAEAGQLRAGHAPGPDAVPAGHYAIKLACTCPGGARPESSTVHVSSCNAGQLRFYRLWRGDRNPNFIKLYLQHGTSETEIPFRAAKGIVQAILDANPFEAARTYGKQIGSCSNPKCGRRLTNRISRLLGIGPVCGGHMCSPDIWAGMKRRARQALLDAGLDPDADVEDTDDLDAIRAAAGL
jgi:hypothetical protein